MPAPRKHRPIQTDRPKPYSEPYPWTMVTVADRLVREAYATRTPLEIHEFVNQAAGERGLANKLHYPWWYEALPKDRVKPRTDAQREVLAHARQRKAELREEAAV